MRKLATIRKIDEIRPIPEAELIECAVIGGWTVVVKKGEYRPGDVAVYCEIDSWIPTELAPFLSKGQEPREYNGVKGERLRTVCLRGQLSQGLLLKPADVMSAKQFTLAGIDGDVTELLGIQKWEAPIPAQLAGEVRGTFPSFIPKTDQERIQNMTAEIEDYRTRELSFEVTEKLDGSSMTVYSFEGDAGVCSRNLNLRETEGNSRWAVARRERLLDKIAGRDIALQGELIGEGIQGNPYKIKGQQFYVFDIYDIGLKEYFSPQARRKFCEEFEINHVPVYGEYWQITETVPEMLKRAEMKSTLNDKQEQEGVVYKCNQDPAISFKCISNKFLLKGGN